MITPPPPISSTTTSTSTSTPLSHLIQTTLPYNSNLMLAAIISLLLVILFVLLLHIYARWFLVQARQRSRSSVTVPHVLASRFTIIDTTFDSSSSPSKGLHPSQISSLLLFAYNHNTMGDQNGLECAICISLFEEEEVGRKLPKCRHAFHVECIDMWLFSHSTCPICRAGVVCEDTKNNVEINDDLRSGLHLEIDVIEDLNMENVDDNSSVTAARFSLSETESTLSGRLKRMLSTNRSERKVHPSAGNVTELEV